MSGQTNVPAAMLRVDGGEPRLEMQSTDTRQPIGQTCILGRDLMDAYLSNAVGSKILSADRF